LGVTGLVALVSWCNAILPAGLWLRLLWRERAVFLAGLLVGLAACLAGWLTDQLWQPLSSGTFWIVRHLLTLMGLAVRCEPAEFLVGTPTFTVTIAPACSGYQGIGLVLVFLGVYLWLFRSSLRFPHAFLLLPIAALAVWLVNALRITLLILIGTFVSESLASEGFHSVAGWLAFIAIALGLVAVTQRHGFLAIEPHVASEPSAAPAYLVPLLALVATAMIAGALVPGFDYCYPVRVLVVGAVLFVFRGRYTGLSWSWSGWALAVGVAVFALWAGLDLIQGGSASEPAMAAGLATLPAGWAAGWLVFRAIGYIVMTPVVEELAFRGYLFRRLMAADFEKVSPGQFTWPAFLVSSLTFGALHGRWFAGTLAGMMYAALYCRRGRLGDCIIAHAATNALLALCALLTGKWTLWS
jgi:exosortase E/protease (VPEID-CTERM system)